MTAQPLTRTPLTAKLAGFGTTIFAEMSALAVQTGSINLGQGFPDTDGPPEVLDAAVEAIRSGVNQYPPGPGVPVLRQAIADHQRRFYGLELDPDREVLVTAGATEALAGALLGMLDSGDEVVVFEPMYDSYQACIALAGAIAKPVVLRPGVGPQGQYGFDADELRAAFSARTKLVLVNTPHNPTGRIYPLESLQAVADVLTEASARNGRTVYLIADEPYNRIVYDGRPFRSPAEVYPATMINYSFGKTLLAPGMRIGYIATPPGMPDRERLRNDIFTAQIATGWAFPNALLQHAIEDLDGLSIDVGALQRRRDRVVTALRGMGYETTDPEGTFYVMARAPIADDMAFGALLADHGVLILPGTVVEAPGWFRISLTASDEMVERGLPGFERARAAALAGPSV